MAEAPAFPLWTDAYLADTGHLTTIEHGAYLLLLMTMWRQGGSLPNDDVKLARVARMTRGQWNRVKPTIMEFFRADGEQLYQSRLTDELEFVRQKRKTQQNNARSKHRKTKETGSATAGKRQSRGSAPTPLYNTDTNVSGENAPNWKQLLFSEGRESLQAQTGKPASAARSLIGKLLKSAGDDARLVFTEIKQCEADQRADPVAWLMRACAANAGNPQNPHSRQMAAFAKYAEMENEQIQDQTVDGTVHRLSVAGQGRGGR